MTIESMTDIAYNKMKANNSPIAFYDLWAEVVNTLGLTKEESDNLISHFYTNITMDGRFINVGENKWDVRENVKFDKVHIDMNDVYDEDEAESGEDADNEDEDAEYSEGSDEEESEGEAEDSYDEGDLSNYRSEDE